MSEYFSLAMVKIKTFRKLKGRLEKWDICRTPIRVLFPILNLFIIFDAVKTKSQGILFLKEPAFNFF